MKNVGDQEFEMFLERDVLTCKGWQGIQLIRLADEAFSLVASYPLGSLVLGSVLNSLKSPQYFSSSGFSLSSNNHILLLSVTHAQRPRYISKSFNSRYDRHDSKGGMPV